MRKYFYSTFFFCCIASESLRAESILKPRNVDLGIDLGRMAYYSFLLEPTFGFLNYGYTSSNELGSYKPSPPKYHGLQYETYLALQYSRIIVDLEFGFGKIEWRGRAGRRAGLAEDVFSQYQAQGKYFKLGLDLNFLKNTPENNAAFIGLRYCLSAFDDSLKTKLAYTSSIAVGADGSLRSNTTPIDQKPYKDVDTSQKNVLATWVEAVAGVKVHLFSIVSCGCNLRYKFWLKIYNADLHRPWDVLGWGLNNDPVDKSAFGYNLYLSISLPLGKPDPYDRMADKRKTVPTNINGSAGG